MGKLYLQRLNMDNTWVVKIGETSILIDPWLHGDEVDYFRWFNTQSHKTKPIDYASVPDFDIVLITQKYPDHFHKETLLRLSPKKLIVPGSIYKAVKKLLPEAEVVKFDLTLKSVFNTPINLHHFPTNRKIDPIYDSLVLEDGHQSVFVSTHGHAISASAADRLNRLPKVSLLITPFNRYKLPVFLGGVVSPGIEGVSHLMKKIKPKYVVATHDEDKEAKGLVSKFAKVIISPDKDELSNMDFLKNRYLAVEDYKMRELQV
jgi:L-ascorbate metabolism protein UlaG (beta-lactamase superfamily)